jgi:hypothetical protein
VGVAAAVFGVAVGEEALGIPGGDAGREPDGDDLRLHQGGEEVALPAAVEVGIGEEAAHLVGVAGAEAAVGGDPVDVGAPVEVAAGGVKDGDNARLSRGTATRLLEGL